jgi:hypothetical protein
MTEAEQLEIPDGWIGGFEESNPAFSYPAPDLSSLPMLGNMDNIHKLTRQQAAIWPQFSWLTVPGDDSSRCFQMFAPDISRIGYTDRGRVYSVICPQQGSFSPSFGTLNIEVTVTGNRGWVDEPSRTLAADISVEGNIWFSPSAHENFFVRMLWDLFAKNGLPFPSTKANAIKVNLYNAENPLKQALPVRAGEATRFKNPDFARHSDKAFAVSNVEVGIGPIRKVGHAVVDDFNQLVMDAFNLASGNLLTPGNILTWNVWVTGPQLVDQDEWKDHAERWRKSIDTGHGSPDGRGTPPRYFDGRPFSPIDSIVQEEIDKIVAFLKRHLPNL